MCGDQLDGTGWCIREVEAVFRLPAMARGKLGKDGDTAEPAVFVFGDEIATVSFVAEEVDIGKMNLGALAVGEPVFNTLIGAFLDVFGDGYVPVNVDDFDSLG